MRLEPRKQPKINYHIEYPDAYQVALKIHESGDTNYTIKGWDEFIPTTTTPVYGGWVYFLQFFYRPHRYVITPDYVHNDDLQSYMVKVGITRDLFGRIKAIKSDKQRYHRNLPFKDMYLTKISLRMAWYFDESVDIVNIESGVHFILSPRHINGEYFDCFHTKEILAMMDKYNCPKPTDDHKKLLKSIGVECLF